MMFLKDLLKDSQSKFINLEDEYILFLDYEINTTKKTLENSIFYYLKKDFCKNLDYFKFFIVDNDEEYEIKYSEIGAYESYIDISLNFIKKVSDVIRIRVYLNKYYFNYIDDISDILNINSIRSSLVKINYINIDNKTKVGYLLSGNMDSLLDDKSKEKILNKKNYENCDYFFDSCSLSPLPKINLEKCTSAKYMYRGTNIIDLNNIDTSCIEDLTGMFVNCKKLVNVDNLNLDSAKEISYLFDNCYMIKNINNLDIFKFENLNNVFSGCQNLTSIEGLDTSDTKFMNYTFQNCRALTSIPNLDTSKCTGMLGTFKYCKGLTTFPNLNISECTNTSEMFYECSKLTTIPNLDMSCVSSAYSMFYYCEILKTVPFLNTQNVRRMDRMFAGCRALTRIEGLDVSSADILVSNMFYDCGSLEYVKLLSNNINTLKKVIEQLPTFSHRNATLDLSEVEVDIQDIVPPQGWTIITEPQATE